MAERRDSRPDGANDSGAATGSSTAVGEPAPNSGAAGSVDLSPRELDGGAHRPRRRWMPIVVIAGLLVAGGVIVTQFLTSAVDYYCNVDEIGTRDGCSADRRVRVQGVVEQGSVRAEGARTDFVIGFNGAALPVSYDGEPGGIFKECVPVVVHGSLDASTGVFLGDRVEVKHSDDYVAENAERLDESEESGAECAGGAQDA